MKIASSQVNMSNDYHSGWAAARLTVEVKPPKPDDNTSASNVELSEKALEKIRLQARNSQDPSNPQGQTIGQSGSMRQQLLVAAGSESFTIERTITGESNEAGSSQSVTEVSYYNQSTSVMKMIIERMTGKTIVLFNADQLSQRAVDTQDAGIPAQVPGKAAPEGEAEPRWLRVTEYQYEKQSNLVNFLVPSNEKTVIASTFLWRSDSPKSMNVSPQK